jgi:polysaccharide biosynthesis protein PslE
MATATNQQPALPLFSLRDVLDVIFRRKRQVLSVMGAIVLAAVAVSLAMSPKYDASSRILIKVGREDLYVPTISQGMPMNIPASREERINSELRILNSRLLIDKVVRNIGALTLYPNLAPKPPGAISRFLKGLLPARKQTVDPAVAIHDTAVAIFTKALKVELTPKSSVINLTFRHPDPAMAAHALDVLDEAFLEQHLLVYQNSQTHKFFDEQAEKLAKELRDAENELMQFKNRAGTSLPDRQRELLLEQMSRIQDSINEARADETEATALATLQQQQLRGTSKTVTLDEKSDFNPETLSSIQGRLVDLELKARELGENAPQENLQEQIRLTRDKLRAEETKRFTSSRTGLNDVYQSLQKNLLESESRAQAMKSKATILSEQMQDLQQRLATLNTAEVEFSMLKQNVDTIRENHRLYVTKGEEARVSEAMDAERIANVSVIDPPVAPHKPSVPKPFLNFILSVLVGGLAGLSVAFALEYLDNTVYRAEQIEQALGIPVLESISSLTLSEFPDVPIRHKSDVEDGLDFPVFGIIPRLA